MSWSQFSCSGTLISAATGFDSCIARLVSYASSAWAVLAMRAVAANAAVAGAARTALRTSVMIDPLMVCD